MEELRLLEQQAHQQHQQQQQQHHQQAIQALALSDLMQGQGGRGGGGGGMFQRGREGSLDLSSTGHDPLLGMSDYDLSQLQAAMRLREQQQQQQQNTGIGGSGYGSFIGSRAALSTGMSTQQLLGGGSSSSQFSGRINEPLFKLPGGFDVVNSIRKRPLDNMWGLGGAVGGGGVGGAGFGGNLTGGQSSLQAKQHLLAGKSKNDFLFGNPTKSSSSNNMNVVLDGCKFPLPLLTTAQKQRKRRRIEDRLKLKSYKFLWANSRTTSRVARRELFARMLHHGTVRIMDKSGLGNRRRRKGLS